SVAAAASRAFSAVPGSASASPFCPSELSFVCCASALSVCVSVFCISSGCALVPGSASGFVSATGSASVFASVLVSASGCVSMLCTSAVCVSVLCAVCSCAVCCGSSARTFGTHNDAVIAAAVRRAPALLAHNFLFLTVFCLLIFCFPVKLSKSIHSHYISSIFLPQGNLHKQSEWTAFWTVFFHNSFIFFPFICTDRKSTRLNSSHVSI